MNQASNQRLWPRSLSPKQWMSLSLATLAISSVGCGGDSKSDPKSSASQIQSATFPTTALSPSKAIPSGDYQLKEYRVEFENNEGKALFNLKLSTPGTFNSSSDKLSSKLDTKGNSKPADIIVFQETVPTLLKAQPDGLAFEGSRIVSLNVSRGKSTFTESASPDGFVLGSAVFRETNLNDSNAYILEGVARGGLIASDSEIQVAIEAASMVGTAHYRLIYIKN